MLWIERVVAVGLFGVFLLAQRKLYLLADCIAFRRAVASGMRYGRDMTASRMPADRR